MIRAARLRRSRDIAAVQMTGRAVRRPAFVARVRPSPVRTIRIAVTASRSIGTAVVRNRARRRVREAFRHELARTSRTGIDVLVAVRPEAVAAPFAALRADVAGLLREGAE